MKKHVSGKKTTKRKKAVHFFDYTIVTPMIPTALRLTLMVGPPGRTPYNTHHNVCLMKLEWKKSGSESEQLTELDAMLAEYGIILSSEGTNGDPSSNETKMKIPSASNPQAVIYRS